MSARSFKILMFLSLWLDLDSGRLFSQPVSLEMVVDSVQMTIGDYNRASLRLKNFKDGNPQWITTIQDSVQNIEIIRDESWQPEGQGLSKSILFSVYDTGFVWLPAQLVVLGTDTLRSESIPLTVLGVPVDSTGLAPIKDIIAEPLSWQDIMPVVLIIGGVLLVAGLAFWWLKRRKSLPVKIPEVPPVPPDELALQKLLSLEQSAAWEKGEIKAFQSDLTFILREYLENQFHLPALEQTSVEIIRDAQNKQLPGHWISSLKELLTAADFVKFAKAQPPLDIHPRMLMQARQLILDSQTFINPGPAPTMPAES